MIKKGLASALAVVFLAGCGNSVSNIEPLTLEEVAGSRLAQMSNDEKEGLIYKLVSDRIVVDKEKLISIEGEDLIKINKLLDKVHESLRGVKSDVLKEEYANYMLTEFSKTPYQWGVNKVEGVGFDPASRLFFVDVSYKTTSKFKSVVPSSKIPNGSEDEEVLKQKRYADYVAVLNAKANGDSKKANDLMGAFKNAWGDVNAIRDEQQGVSLLERTKQTSGIDGIGGLTYTGIVKDSELNSPANMTFRYVFKYAYNLGEETDLKVHAVYLKDYEMPVIADKLDTEGSTELEGVEVLKPFVDRVLLSYNKAVDGENDTGLHSLFYNYADYDKYYGDIHKYAYKAVGGYNYEIVDRTGTTVTVKMNRVNQIRAKGADISYPTYDETWLTKLVLDTDDKIKIGTMTLVSSKMVGEPLSVIRNVTGVSDMIQYSGESFTSSNQGAVEDAVKKFSTVVFNGKVDDPSFTSIVDIGVSDTTLRKISDTVMAIPDASRKTTYVTSWNTKTNVFVSLTLREVFEKGSYNLDTESVVDLVNRDGEWKVVNYNRTMNVKTKSVKLDAKTALSEDTR